MIRNKNQGNTIGDACGMIHTQDCRATYRAFQAALKALEAAQAACPMHRKKVAL